MGDAKRRKAEIDALKASGMPKASNIKLRFPISNVRDMYSMPDNNTIANQLSDWRFGFTKLFELGKFTIYQPVMPCDGEATEKWRNLVDSDDTWYDKHLQIYKYALGGVESVSFNAYQQLEHISDKQLKKQNGQSSFNVFDCGAYRLNLMVVREASGTIIVPMLDHSWDKQNYTFNPAYGAPVTLPHILALVARTILTGIPTSGFNDNRQKLIQNIFDSTGMMVLTPNIERNWFSIYECCYDLYQHLIDDNYKNSNFTFKNYCDMISALD
jgi:hypothetical protein